MIITVTTFHPSLMPPEGYHAVTISDELAEKLGRVMVEYEIERYTEAIEYTVGTVLVR